jgi:accessory colonization factor AcfC
VRFVTDERWGRPVRRAFLIQLAAVAFLGWIAWSEAAAEPDPADLVSMLDHAAIVESMALACEDSRPDLAAAFREARQRWWVRNAEIHQTLATLEREIGKPRAKAFLDYLNSLQRSLQQQIEDQRHAGNAQYAARCDGVLNELTRGRMDYRQSDAASGAR